MSKAMIFLLITKVMNKQSFYARSRCRYSAYLAGLSKLGLILLLVMGLQACEFGQGKSLEVTATAYNSLPEQTRLGSSGAIAAWGDTLKPGMKCIAVSRDLIDSGLSHNTRVRIEGLQGTFLVKDKMNRRWTKKIDIYMGKDSEKAKNWGKKQVTIHW